MATIDFRDVSPVDYTGGSWDDESGLMNHQAVKRRRRLGEGQIPKRSADEERVSQRIQRRSKRLYLDLGK